jgi:hypothetical protein
MKHQTWKRTTETAQDSPQGYAGAGDHDSPEAREARRLDHYRRAAALARFFPNPDRYDPYNPL